MFFTDYLSDHSLSLLRLSERDHLYSPWTAEWDFSKPDEPVCLIWRCVQCGVDLIDLTDMNREQAIGVLQKPDIFQKFHIARIFVPIRDREPIEVYSCESCARAIRNPDNFERVKFANLCLWLRAYIEMGKDEAFLRSGVQELEGRGLDYSKVEILKEN
jgi:hypothetical protein